MLAVVFGLLGAFIYGAADFFGGLGARRIGALRITALVAVSGLFFLGVIYPFFGGEWSAEAVTLGLISGVTGAGAIGLLYACLAIGPMSILSPLTAVVSAIVPLTVGVVRGERFEAIGYVAIGLALVAVVLVGFVPDERAVRPSGRALAMAIGSGTLIGVFLVIIDLTPDDSGLVPLLANRASNAVIMFLAIGVIVLVGRRRSTRASAGGGGRAAPPSGSVETPPGSPQLVARAERWAPGIRFAIAGGMADAAANVCLLLALREGGLSIASVLTAMYPAGTILLAAIALRERIAPSQWVGLVLAITAAGMLALA